MGDRKAGRQPRRLLDAHTHSNMRTERQTVTTTLPLEFTALGWSKSLSPVFFVFTSSGHFDIGTSQNLASCSTTADFTIQIYIISVNSNLRNITVGSLEFIGLVRSHDCHKSHRSKMV